MLVDYCETNKKVRFIALNLELTVLRKEFHSNSANLAVIMKGLNLRGPNHPYFEDKQKQ